MVKQKKALQVSAISAGIITAIHYFAHQLITTNAVRNVSIVVFISVFTLGYWGMRR